MTWSGRGCGVLAGALVLLLSPGAFAADATATDYTTYYRYDAMGRVTMKIGPDPDGAGGQPRRVETSDYDAEGRVIAKRVGTTAAAPAVLTGTDDPPVSYKAELMVRYRYDAVGNKIRETSAVGLTQLSYDGANRLECTAVRMSVDAATSDPTVGACEQTLSVDSATGPDRISKNTYDAAGQLVSVQRGWRGGLAQPVIEETGYTANGQVAYRRDANLNTSSYIYDGFDRLIEFQLPVRPRAQSAQASASDPQNHELYAYDANGNRTRLTKRDGQVFEFEYDALNRQILKNGPGAAGDVVTDYDLMGRVLSVSWPGSSVTLAYDRAGRRTRETTTAQSWALPVSSRYDAAGNRTHVIWGSDPAPPSLAGLTYAAYAYDYADSLTTISNSNGDVLESFAYDAVGRPQSVTAGNGVISTVKYQDATGLLEWIHHDGFAANTKIWQGFEYNAAGQIVSQSQSNPNLIWTGQPNKTTSLTYNGLNQDATVAALAGNSCSAVGAGYDCNGNLKVDVAAGVSASDSATRKFAYDAENRLTGVDKTTSDNVSTTMALAYDPTGRLLTTSANGVVTRFLYDGDRLIGEYSASNILQRRYVHGIGTDTPLVWLEGANDNDRNWLHVDRQGSVIAYSRGDASLVTYAYGPYGEAQSWAGSRFRYTGQIALPEAELYHYKARAYDPRIGRFLQTDPTGYDDGLNWYAYVGNDPLNKSDPSGLLAESGFWANFSDDVRRGSKWFASAAYRVASLPGQVAGGESMRAGTAMTNLATGKGTNGDVKTLMEVGVNAGLAIATDGASGAATVRRAEGAADAALAAGQGSGAAAELVVGGRVFTGVSGQAVVANSEVTGALMGTPARAREAWHGGCAEIVCLNKAMNAGVNPAGGSSRAVNIGSSGAGHNTPKAPCRSCQDVLRYFGVKF